MALDAHRPMSSSSDGPDVAPAMFSRPPEAPPPLPHVRGAEAVQSLHGRWAAAPVAAAPDGPPSSLPRRLARKARRMAATRRSDREILGALIRAVDTIALRCDEIADRLSAQEGLMEDITSSFGRDITALQADIIRLRSLASPADDPSRDG